MDFYVLAINGAIFRIVPASFASANPTSYTLSTLNSQGQQQHLQSLSTLPANITNKVTIVGVKGTNSYDPNPIYVKAGERYSNLDKRRCNSTYSNIRQGL